MIKLLLILFASILFSGELEVTGDLKVSGSIESTTIDSLKAVIAQLQAQLAALQAQGGLETRIFESNVINFEAYQDVEIILDINSITNYDLAHYSIIIYDVIDFQVTDNVNAAADFSLNYYYTHPVYGWMGVGNQSGEIYSSGEYYFTPGSGLFLNNLNQTRIHINDGHNSGYIKFSFAVTAQFPN